LLETFRAVGLEESELTIVLNKEQIATLTRAKEVTSHSHFNASTAELIEVMGRFFLQHKDPLKAKLRESTKLALNNGMTSGQRNRIQGSIKQLVWFGNQPSMSRMSVRRTFSSGMANKPGAWERI
jgi:hypothetical protein